MSTSAEFVLAHISDLHFSSGGYSAGNHIHSIPHLLDIERILGTYSLDRLIVSGDLTDNGDPESLLRAKMWLFSSFAVDGSRSTGLNLPPGKVGLVPGNHDAFNRNTDHLTGLQYLERWQKSLEHFNDLFQSHSYRHPHTCRYDWIEKADRGVFLAYADTSFLGDTRPRKGRGLARENLLAIPRVACGRLHHEQTEQLLKWFHEGMRGRLSRPNDPANCISSELFAKSLKILVTHHFLFEPPGSRIDRALHLVHARAVFVNVASADFDIHLCGHKHVDAVDARTYGALLDRRGKTRHLINLFRRSIGIHPLPLILKDQKGLLKKRSAALLLGIVYLMEKVGLKHADNADSESGQQQPHDAAFVEALLDRLRKALDRTPSDFGRDFRRFLKKHDLVAPDILHPRELQELMWRVESDLSPAEKTSFSLLADRVSRLARQLSSRPFLQVLAASAAKHTDREEKHRSFNVYRILADDAGYGVETMTYRWDATSRRFEP